MASVARTRELELHGVVMCDAPEMIGIGLPPLHAPHWEPLWDALQAEEMPVSFHVGSGKGRLRCVEACWPNYEMAEFMTIMPAELFLSNSATIGNLIVSGLCERYPRLRFFSVESGVGYLPFYLQALDYQYVEGGLDRTGRLPLLPSEYFRRQIYCSFWFETFGVAEAIGFLGSDQGDVQTDFPHPSCLYPGTATRIDAFAATVDDETLERVLSRNAAELFDLPAHRPRRSGTGGAMSGYSDVDFVGGAFWAGDPDTTLTWLRANDPVHLHEPTGMWGITKYDDIRHVETDQETFTATKGILPGDTGVPMMATMDDPAHMARRRLMSTGFTPKRVQDQTHTHPGGLRPAD